MLINVGLIPSEEWDSKDKDQSDINVWEDKWDDDTVQDDFSVHRQKGAAFCIFCHFYNGLDRAKSQLLVLVLPDNTFCKKNHHCTIIYTFRITNIDPRVIPLACDNQRGPK